jgi:gliding motility-associated protein GldE
LESEPPSALFLSGIFLFQTIPLITSTGAFLGILILAVLLLCSALISGTEVAYFSLSPDDIQTLKDESTVVSKRVLHLKRFPRRLLATILIANNFINIAIVVLSDYLVNEFLGADGFAGVSQFLSENISFLAYAAADYARLLNFLVTVVGVTFLLVLFGEVAPKIYAKFNNLSFARSVSGSITTLNTLFYPLSSLLVGWSKRLERSLDMSGNSQDHKDQIEEAIELTVIGDQHARQEVNILKSILKFNEVSVKQIMRSRVDVIAESKDSSLEEVLATIQSSGYSRIPIYEESIDHIIGLLYAKDFIGHESTLDWNKIIRKDVHYVPESKRINELLKEFQQKRLHMAIVVDEYGGVSGLVTLEDVMEEVIGEITDEFDEGGDVEFIKIDEKTFVFEGKSLINDVCRIMGVDTDVFDEKKGEADSVAGLMLEQIGHIPRQTQELKIDNFTLRAERVNRRRIEKVKILID